MRRWRDVTFGQAFDSLSEYRPVLVLLAGILILSLIVPGTGREEVGEIRDDQAADTGTAPGQQGQTTTVDGATTGSVGGADQGAQGGTSGQSQGTTTVDTGGSGGTVAAESETAPQQPQDTGPPPAAQFAEADAADAPDCDPETGRIAIPSFYAPDCVPLWPEGADNGGATYQGVTADTIRIAIWNSEDDDQAQAILADAGAEGDDREQEEQDADRDFVYQTLSNIFETYGRDIEWEWLDASGDDCTAYRGDARRAANEMQVFAVLGGPQANCFANELVAHQVLCFCTVSQPHFNHLRWAPFVWGGTLMSSTAAYMHRAEFVGKKLWGKPPEHSPDPNFALEERRRFGLIYFETEDEAYASGVDFFEEELAKYGAQLTDRVAYIFNLAEAQQQAAPIIQRFKDQGITSILFAGDPLYPIFFTQEATQQQYFPEWVVTGSALTDTAFFARTYDQQQWQNAFGVSFLPARMSPDYRDAEPDLAEWACDCEREETPGDSRTGTFVRFLSGVHLAGPNLNPETFRDGKFSWTGKHGYITRLGFNFGPGVYPWDDYTFFDDTTEIWWDPQAQGEDEIGNEGFGLYHYVRGGLRFLPGEQDGTDRAFEEDGTVFWYDERPPGEETPKYESRGTREEPFQRKDSW